MSRAREQEQSDGGGDVGRFRRSRVEFIEDVPQALDLGGGQIALAGAFPVLLDLRARIGAVRDKAVVAGPGHERGQNGKGEIGRAGSRTRWRAPWRPKPLMMSIEAQMAESGVQVRAQEPVILVASSDLELGPVLGDELGAGLTEKHLSLFGAAGLSRIDAIGGLGGEGQGFAPSSLGRPWTAVLPDVDPALLAADAS
ncbi:MAG: hypothetical protein R3D67_21080 [Hyphomicrobiaceae bacterium]